MKNRIFFPAIFAVLLASGIAGQAQAHENKFGDPGTFEVGGRVGLDLDVVLPAQGGDSTTGWSLQIGPEVMAFVVENFAIGGHINLDVAEQQSVGSRGATSTEIGVGIMINPKIGVNIPFSETLGLWLKGGPGFFIQSDIFMVDIVVDAHVVMHDGNFFIGFGPSLNLGVWAQAGNAAIDNHLGIMFNTTIGGWIPSGGGSSTSEYLPDVSDAPAPAAAEEEVMDM